MRRSVAVSLLALPALGACQDPPRAAPDASAPPLSSPSTTVHATAPKPAACRIVSGDGMPPTADPTHWLDVPAKATFAIHVTDTGRELRFTGPGRVDACRNGTVLLASGTVANIPGAGDAPGSEIDVAMPCAFVRWTAGIVRVEADGCNIQPLAGEAHVWLGDKVRADAGAHDSDGWVVVAKGEKLHLDPPVDPSGAVAACEAAAKRVDDIAASMKDAGSALGDLATDSVRARAQKRATCALAMLRATGNPDFEGRVSAVER